MKVKEFIDCAGIALCAVCLVFIVRTSLRVERFRQQLNEYVVEMEYEPKTLLDAEYHYQRLDSMEAQMKATLK